MISRLFKLLLFLAIAGFIGLAGFAYFGDLSPERTETRVPVTLNVD